MGGREAGGAGRERECGPREPGEEWSQTSPGSTPACPQRGGSVPLNPSVFRCKIRESLGSLSEITLDSTWEEAAVLNRWKGGSHLLPQGRIGPASLRSE